MEKQKESPRDSQSREPHLRSVRLTSDFTLPHLTAIESASYLLTFVSLWLVLELNLLGGVLAGLLVYQLVHTIAPVIERHTTSRSARWFAVVLLSIAIVGLLAGLTVGILEHFEHTVPNLQNLLGQVMQIVDQTRARTPAWIANLLPVDVAQMKAKASLLMSAHMEQLQQSGKSVARGLGHVLFGMIVGAMIAIGVEHNKPRMPLSTALVTRVSRFADSFRRIVFAQVKISALNVTLTGVYLLVVLPAFHVRLPLSKTLVLVTFITGLLPVIGNLISNTLIVAVSLSIGMSTAIASLVFLVLVHKLEYFLNARIVGVQIEARAWEILLAMIVMEAAFGVPGVIAAPIFYAYLKRELHALRLI
ncbi:AI-2E family transporter [Burkholderia guangdongensis]|uniref:AI-2E family transporter n=1 Tax=Burkholderia guangdongensis TaxID=1792500 RepID=UPI0015C93F0F|nr:AI-2E family transporter [Burkholderia guangdongensis]